MAARFWVAGGTGNWNSTTNWSATSGGTSGASVPGSSDTATFNASSGSGTATLDISPTIQTLTCTGFTGTLAFDANTISLNSTGTIFTGATTMTVTGTPLIICTNSSATSRTINPTAVTEANSISFRLAAGISPALATFGAGAVRDIDFTDGTNPTGFGGQLSTFVVTIYGNFKASTNMTVSSSTNTMTFAATSGTKTINTAGVTFDRAFTFNGVGGTWQLQAALISGAARTCTLINGTLDLAGYTLTTGLFNSNNSNTRTLAFGTGKIVITGTNATVYATATATNLTLTGAKTVEVTGVGAGGETRTITGGAISAGGIAANSANFYIKAGADIISFTTIARTYGTIDFTGFSGSTLTNVVPSIYGSLVLSTGMTVTAGTGVWTFAATTSQTITTNGKTLDFPITFNGVGGAWSLQDALTLGSARALTLTNGTITTNGYAVTAGIFSSTGATIRALNLDGSTVTMTGTGTAWDITDSTNMTLNASTSLLVFNSSSAPINFQGGNQKYNNITYAGGQVFTVYGNNTFNSILNATNLTFQAGSTQDVYSFNLTGCTLNSTTSGVKFNLYNKTGQDIKTTSCTIKDCSVSPAGYWYAPLSLGNVNAGNNTGWDFGEPELMSEFMNFLVS